MLFLEAFRCYFAVEPLKEEQIKNTKRMRVKKKIIQSYLHIRKKKVSFIFIHQSKFGLRETR